MTKPNSSCEPILQRETSVDFVKIQSNPDMHRKRIIAEPVEINNDYTPPVYPKNPSDVSFLSQSLRGCFLFDLLTVAERNAAIDAMQKEEFVADTVIIEQGSLGDYFYIVEEGVVTFLRSGVEVGSCTTGATFGELALLYNVPRGASCLAETDVSLWKLDRQTFQFMNASQAKKEEEDVMNVLKKVPFLKELDAMSLKIVSDALVQVNFSLGSKIVEKGEVGKTFYIVMDGEIRIHDIGHGNSTFEDHTLGPGEFFGERALLTGEPRAANVTAATDCTLLVLSKEVFNSVLGDLSALLKKAYYRKILMSTPIFCQSNLRENEIARLMDSFENVNIRKGLFLTRIGGTTRHLGYYIIKEGLVRITTDQGTITTLSKGDHFGGHTINANENEKSTTAIEILEDTKCQVIFKKQIIEAIGSLDRLGAESDVTKQLSPIVKSDLTEISSLGQGAFGKVVLVQHNETKKCYARKAQSKVQVYATKQTNNVIRERNIMACLNHPFVINLVSTYQCKHYLYMIIDLVHGGELFNIIYNTKKPGFPLKTAQFYAACVFESLSYLHSHFIAYRDLKPENILLDKDGYCIIIDFGLAKIVNGKTYSKCGTPEYMAPEVLLGRGYDQRADSWSYGVLLFELIAGHTTFFQKGVSEMVLYQKIIRGRYTFPPDKDFSKESQDLIGQFLARDPVQRLGTRRNYETAVKGHAFFEGLDWGALLKKEISAPYIPPCPKDDLMLGKPLMKEPEPRRVLPEQHQVKFEAFGTYVD